jgi:hypothetical protein
MLFIIPRVQLAGRLKPSFISHALQDVDTPDMDNELEKRVQDVAATIMGGKCALRLPYNPKP